MFIAVRGARCPRFAGGGRWEKTRRLGEPSAHDDLRLTAYQLMDTAALQRGRLTTLTLKVEDLVGADQVAEQRSLDGAREARLTAEEAIDRVPIALRKALCRAIASVGPHGRQALQRGVCTRSAEVYDRRRHPGDVETSMPAAIPVGRVTSSARASRVFCFAEQTLSTG